MEQNLLFQEYEPIKEALKLGDFLSRIKKPEKKEIKKRGGGGGERATIVKEFVDEINNERGTKMKPLTDRYIAVKLGILKTNQELYEFLSECRRYKLEDKSHSFGKRFFGGFKEKDI